MSQALLLRLEMQELLDRYVAAIDDDRLEEWPGFFTEDCLYEIIPRENAEAGLPAPILYCDSNAMLRDRVMSLRRANIYEKPMYRHLLSGLSIGPGGGSEVSMRSNYVVVNTSQEGSSSIYQAGVYEDRVVRTEAGWRFRQKRVVYDTARVATLLAYPI
ncbi:MAG: aromatic-ring-hydroxylating dioxygenase subunit beta [Acetobacteraceae bacterium]|nr:aromatic-ring-hydroxylating dioxygenase subunit beta [Acetobacteraceae bacterium]MBV9776229.1 aromatic-ring-hydroxylating dioxygenase subunit beta [Acetobacteraceae bacterium]